MVVSGVDGSLQSNFVSLGTFKRNWVSAARRLLLALSRSGIKVLCELSSSVRRLCAAKRRGHGTAKRCSAAQ